jgi:multiple sugar transport system permease protein
MVNDHILSKRPFFKKPKMLGLSSKEAIAGYLMILPWMIYFLVFIAGPMVGAFAISFTDWDIITGPKWLGFRNFQNLFHDDIFWLSIYNTFFYTIFAIPFHIIAALITALLMNIRTKFIGIYRTLFYLPCIISPVAIGMIWMWLLYPDFGLVNIILNSINLPSLKWLYDPHLSKAIIIAINTWQFGSTMVIFLAALQDVPRELYEAAEIDGANLLDRIRNVTLPMISPVIFYVLVLQTIASFQVFTYAYVMTNGGPSNSTMFSVLYIWKNAFEYFRMGYASAIGVVLFIITLVVTLLLFWLSKFWVHYETE